MLSANAAVGIILADPVPIAAGIAGARGRDQLIELVLGGLAIAGDAEIHGVHALMLVFVTSGCFQLALAQDNEGGN